MSKRIFSILLSLIMVLAIVPLSVFAEDNILDYFRYEINDGKVTITGCDTSISGDVVIPAIIEGRTVLEIGDWAFEDCNNITSITIPDSVTTIGECAFFDCKKLMDINIPDSVTSIGTDAFYNSAYYKNESNWENGALYIDKHLIGVKESLTGDFEIKQGTITISELVFYACHYVTSITIPESVVSIGGERFDYECPALKSIVVDDDNMYYSSDSNGVLFNKDKTQLIRYPAGKNETAYSIPESVTSIAGLAFDSCNSLADIEIPNSVTDVGFDAFSNCLLLTAVTVPKSVVNIGDAAFGYIVFKGFEKIDGFVVYGYTNSAAETYANENEFKFVAIEESDPELDTKDDENINLTDTVATSAPEMTAETVKNSIKNENIQILDKDGKEIEDDGFVGTGSKINILDKDGNILSTYEVMVKADVDGNGKITTADARLTLRASVGLDTLAGVYEIAANYDGKDTVSTSDARMILRKAVGLE